MGVDGQCHAPAALLPGRSQYPLYRRLGGPQGRSGRVRKRIHGPLGLWKGYFLYQIWLEKCDRQKCGTLIINAPRNLVSTPSILVTFSGVYRSFWPEAHLIFTVVEVPVTSCWSEKFIQKLNVWFQIDRSILLYNGQLASTIAAVWWQLYIFMNEQQIKNTGCYTMNCLKSKYPLFIEMHVDTHTEYAEWFTQQQSHRCLPHDH
jgi:hypothetical protein